MAAMVKSKGALKLSITHGEEAQLMLIYHVCAQRCRWQQIWALEYLSKRSSLLSLRATDCPIQRAGLSPGGSRTGEPAPAPWAAAPGLCCCKVEQRCRPGY